MAVHFQLNFNMEWESEMKEKLKRIDIQAVEKGKPKRD